MSNEHEELVKIRHKVEDLEDNARDQWHENRKKYEARVEEALEENRHRIAIFLAIDGVKSAREIERELHIPHKSAWRAFEHLRKKGLLKLLRNTKGSPVWGKKPWVKELDIDEFVREKSQFKNDQQAQPANQTLDNHSGA